MDRMQSVLKQQSEQTDDRKLNIMFVTSTLYWGGAQKVTSILANELAERQNVTVAYCFDSGRSHAFSGRCNLVKLPEYDRDAGLTKKAALLLRQGKVLRQLKRDMSIDVSVSLGNVSNLLNALSKGRECMICSERSNPKKSWGLKLFLLTILAYKKADYVIFQSDKVRSLFNRSIREKSCILKNPVMIPEPAAELRNKKIVTLGRLTGQKNHKLLIHSFTRFHKDFPDYTLHIYGEGELREDMERLIADLGMQDSIFLEGDDQKVHARIRDAEMFVLSSDFEGLSNALLECMAMGIACISTKCEGSVDVIRDGENGILVDIGDEKALADAMSRLASDHDLRSRIEKQAMKDICAYEKDTVVKDWEKVICSVCGDHENTAG